MSTDKDPETPRPLPRGEVMSTGIVGGVRVELVHYTEQDIRQRDREWQHEVERERSVATQLRCRMMNLEMDLQRVLEGNATLNAFPIVEEIRRRLTAYGLLQRSLPILKEHLEYANSAPVWHCTGYEANTLNALIPEIEAVLGPNVRAKRGQTAAQEMENGTK